MCYWHEAACLITHFETFLVIGMHLGLVSDESLKKISDPCTLMPWRRIFNRSFNTFIGFSVILHLITHLKKIFYQGELISGEICGQCTLWSTSDHSFKIFYQLVFRTHVWSPTQNIFARSTCTWDECLLNDQHALGTRIQRFIFKIVYLGHIFGPRL